MLTLAIDTSSASVCAAVGRVAGDGCVQMLARRATIDARAHAELLSPSIAACLDEAAVTVAELAAVVVGVGPGPFTGLRVGLVTAAAIADARAIPAYAVCSLDGIAFAATGSVLVAADARRREVYWASYYEGARIDGPNVGRAGDVPTAGMQAMVGAGARLYADVFGLALLDADYPDPAALIALAAPRIRANAPGESLTPLYLRRPDAVAAPGYKAVTP